MTHFRIKLLIAIIWLIFTFSLAAWWFLYAWNQIEITAGDSVHSMIKWEGVSLLFALLIGGIAIIFLIYQERKSYRTLNDFYLAFNHDLKNSMTSLQMQVGALRDEYQGEQNPVIKRLERDSRRLQMQLENSLELSKLNSTRINFIDISISDVLGRVRFHEPDIEISLNHDVIVSGDRRILEIVFLNIINNAIKHGQASQISLETNVLSQHEISIRISDNGFGFATSDKQATQNFTPPKYKNGSGLGLYLIEKLMRKIKGEIIFPPPSQDEGFVVLLTLLKAKKL